MSRADVANLEAGALMRQVLEETDQPPFLLTSATKARVLEWLRLHQPMEHADVVRRMRATDERATSMRLYPTSSRQVLGSPTNVGPAAQRTLRAVVHHPSGDSDDQQHR